MFKWVKKAKKIFSGQAFDKALVKIEDDGFMEDAIAVNIEDIIREKEDDEIGKLHVLSLTEFHQVLGELWDAREAKILLLCESVLRQRIGEGNRWEQKSKEIYILLFPTLSDIEGEARTFDIAEELGKKIIGERFDGNRRPNVKKASVDPKDALNEDGTLDIEKLEEIGRNGDSVGDSGPLEDQDTTKELGSEKDDEGYGLDGPNWKKQAHDHEEGQTNWSDQGHTSYSDETDWKKQSHARQQSENSNWVKGEGNQETKNDPNWVSMKDTAKSSQKPKFDCVFAPCWNHAQESLSTYRAILQYVKSSDDLPLNSMAAYEKVKSDDQALKIDQWLLQKTYKALKPLITKEIITPMFIPVHSSSLRDSRLDHLLSTLSKIEEDIRKSYIIIEIMDDGKWDKEALTKAAQALHRQIKACALLVSPQHIPNIPINPFLEWIGVDGMHFDEKTNDLIEFAQNLRTEFASESQKLYCFNLAKRAHISQLITENADLLSGPALVKTTARLRPPFDLPKSRLISS
jgi:EAL domain-containing protein (putative c-di-GMP-specific phosphodiesterase class I)